MANRMPQVSHFDFWQCFYSGKQTETLAEFCRVEKTAAKKLIPCVEACRDVTCRLLELQKVCRKERGAGKRLGPAGVG